MKNLKGQENAWNDFIREEKLNIDSSYINITVNEVARHIYLIMESEDPDRQNLQPWK